MRTRSMNNLRPTPLKMVPYVYKDGDDNAVGRRALLTTTEWRSDTTNVAVPVPVASDPRPQTPASELVAGPASELVAGPASELVPEPVAPKPKARKRKVLDYKSIVRTRAQKRQNAEEQHVQYMQIANDFYKKFGREPGFESVEEAGVAAYLHAVRFCLNRGEDSAELQNLVTIYMPWFRVSGAQVEAKPRIGACAVVGSVLYWASMTLLVVNAATVMLTYGWPADMKFDLSGLKAW